MQEIIIKNNSMNLKVFINGIPDLKLISKNEAEIAITALELKIAEFYNEQIN